MVFRDDTDLISEEDRIAKHFCKCVERSTSVSDFASDLFLMSLRGNYSPFEAVVDYVTTSLWEGSSDRRPGPVGNVECLAAGEASRLCVRIDLKSSRPGRPFFL